MQLYIGQKETLIGSSVLDCQDFEFCIYLNYVSFFLKITVELGENE